jgi:hypothetical protein
MSKRAKKKAPEKHAHEKKENRCERAPLEELPKSWEQKTCSRREDIAS